jgi:hypothetical protein
MSTPSRFEAHALPRTWGRMTMCDAMGPSHAFLGKPGKLRLLVRGESFADLVAEGGRALVAHLSGDTNGKTWGPWRTVEIHAEGREAVLADWLNRLLDLAGRDRRAPSDFRVLAVSNNALRARVRGKPLAARLHLGRAVIPPGSLTSPDGHGLQAEVRFAAPYQASSPRGGWRKVNAKSKGRR